MTATMNRIENQKLKEIQHGVLEAYTRGLLTDSQAMRQLAIRDYNEFIAMLSKAGMKSDSIDGLNAALSHTVPAFTRPSPYREDQQIAEGFAEFWLSQNTTLRDE